MLKELGVRALLVWDNPGRGGGRPAADESENESDSVDTDTTHRSKKRDRNDERALAAAEAAGWKPALQLRLGKSNKFVVYVPPA
jgi:hypothetical protein